jgi:hypothetical protein
MWIPVLPNLTWSKSYFTGACLSFVRVMVAFRRVPLVLLLRQAVMG